MTTTPNSVNELLELNQKEVFAEGLTNTEVVEKLCFHSDREPTDIIELTKLFVDKLITFHINVSAEIAAENDGSVPADKIFWVQDVSKLQTIKFLLHKM